MHRAVTDGVHTRRSKDCHRSEKEEAGEVHDVVIMRFIDAEAFPSIVLVLVAA